MQTKKDVIKLISLIKEYQKELASAGNTIDTQYKDYFLDLKQNLVPSIAKIIESKTITREQGGNASTLEIEYIFPANEFEQLKEEDKTIINTKLETFLSKSIVNNSEVKSILTTAGLTYNQVSFSCAKHLGDKLDLSICKKTNLPGDPIKQLMAYLQRKAASFFTDLVYNTVKAAPKVAEAYVEHKLEETVRRNNDFAASIALTAEFITGLGPANREFREGHPFTESLKNSEFTKIALTKFYDGYLDFIAGKRPEPPVQYRVDFLVVPFVGDTGPFRDLWAEGGSFKPGQFLGTAMYNFDFNQSNNRLNIEVFDTKTEYSFLYHAPGTDRHQRSAGKIMGETTQWYYFSFTLAEVEEICNN